MLLFNCQKNVSLSICVRKRAISLHLIRWQNCKFNGLKSCAVRNMATDIHYLNSGISNMLFMDSKAMTDGVSCFPNILFITALAFNYVNKVSSVT